MRGFERFCLSSAESLYNCLLSVYLVYACVCVCVLSSASLFNWCTHRHPLRFDSALSGFEIIFYVNSEGSKDFWRSELTPNTKLTVVSFRVNPVQNEVTTDPFFIDQRFLITLISTQTSGNSWCESYVREGIKSLFYYRNQKCRDQNNKG